jgi:hypothetical protein
MLTFEEYLLLNEDLQSQVLSWDGVYLDLARNASKLSVELYALYDFYVEIFFDKETEEPIFLKPFADLKKLDPYLASMDLTELLGIREEGQ